MILTFLDMTAQHLQPGMAQPAECPSRFGVIGMIICVSDVGGSMQFLSLALTNLFLSVLVFFRLKHGFGMRSVVSLSGLSTSLMAFKSRSGVYSITKKVSYGHVVLSLPCSMRSLSWKGSERHTLWTNLDGYPLSIKADFILSTIFEYSCSSEQPLNSLVSSPLIMLEKVRLGWAEV